MSAGPAPFTCLALSPCERLVAAGGRDVLKTYALHWPGGNLIEARNLRARQRKSLDLAVVDVAWQLAATDRALLLATCATNGAVCLWDAEVGTRLDGGNAPRHARAVNRLAWHPAQAPLLLSASQDGTARLWDARGGNGGLAEAASFAAGAEAVRDAQWDPFSSFLFAAALEDGRVQLWDIRAPAAPVTSFVAHAGLVSCLHWHPTAADVLATGGRDRLVCLWATGSRAQKFADAVAAGDALLAAAPPPRARGGESLLTTTPPEASAAARGLDSGASEATCTRIATIQTIASVGRVCWRGGSSSDAAAAGVERFHLAVCSALLLDSAAASVWDVRSRYLPAAIFAGHRDVVTGLSWAAPRPSVEPDNAAARPPHAALADTPADSLSSGSWLLSSGRDGRLLAHDPTTARRPHADLRTTCLAMSASGVAWSFARFTHADRDALWPAGPKAAGSSGAAGTDDCGGGSSGAPPVVRVLTLGSGGVDGGADCRAGADALRAIFPSSAAFVGLASAYALAGAEPHLLCAQNGEAAAAVGMALTAAVWRVCAALWTPATRAACVQPPALSVPAVASLAAPAADSTTAAMSASEALVKTPLPAAAAARVRLTVPGVSVRAGASGEPQRIAEVLDMLAFVHPAVPALCAAAAARGDGGAEEGAGPEGNAAAKRAARRNGTGSTRPLARRKQGGFGGQAQVTPLASAPVAAAVGAAAEAVAAVSPVASPYKQSTRGPPPAAASVDAGADASAATPAPLPPQTAAEAAEAAWRTLQLGFAADALAAAAEAGDVQLCACLCAALGADGEAAAGGAARAHRWRADYTELLQRHELWAPADALLALADDGGAARKANARLAKAASKPLVDVP